MHKDYNISHQHHPARQGKSLALVHSVKFAIVSGRKLMIGSADVDALYDRLKTEYPEAKLSKHKGYVLVEKGK